MQPELRPQNLTTATPKAAADVRRSGASRDQRLWEASVGFESMFLTQMLKAMRRTVQNSDLTRPSQGREIFTEMLDGEYARLAGKSRGAGPDAMERAGRGTSNSIAAQIYRSLKRREDGTLPAPPSLDSAPIWSRFPGVVPGAHPSGQAPEIAPRPAAPADHTAASIPRTGAGRLPEQALERLAAQASERFGVDKNLIRSVIRQESAGDSRAVSRAGAKGLMQLMDSTASDLGVRDVFNPVENVMAGTRYLAGLLRRFQGDEKLALAAYNAGPGNVEKHGGIPPFPETRDYVKKVLERRSGFDAAGR